MITQSPTFLVRLREAIEYDPISGEFHRLKGHPINGNLAVGSRAGSKDRHGHLRISFENKQHASHRLAWLLMTGAWPSAHIDHINGDRSDNRWSNLRDVSPSVNSQNRKAAKKNSSTGLLGVSRHGGNRFRADICTGGKKQFLGVFDDPQLAHQAYIDAKRINHQGNTL
jgi:hypothetical protein